MSEQELINQVLKNIFGDLNVRSAILSIIAFGLVLLIELFAINNEFKENYSTKKHLIKKICIITLVAVVIVIHSITPTSFNKRINVVTDNVEIPVSKEQVRFITGRLLVDDATQTIDLGDGVNAHILGKVEFVNKELEDPCVIVSKTELHLKDNSIDILGIKSKLNNSTIYVVKEVQY